MRIKAEISFSAFRNNIQKIKALVSPAKFMLVVKANAYGHGIRLISEIAEKAGADWLGVTSAAEAIDVRETGTQVPLLCFFEPENREEALELIYRDVSFNVFSEKSLSLAVNAAQVAQKPARIHIKINTGMNRLGSSSDKALEILTNALASKSVIVEGLWTHLATSELPDSEFAIHQINEFEKLKKSVKKLTPSIMFHAANTGGALFYPSARFDMVRVGIGAYGYYPSAGYEKSQTDLKLEPVLRLKTRVTAVRRINPGEGVSYGLKWRADRKTCIGIVAAGYADGIPYSASGKIFVSYKGKLCPQIGSICMDQFAVDFKDTIPEIDDEVEIISPVYTAEDIAIAAGTITYEVLTRIGTRVHRAIVD